MGSLDRTAASFSHSNAWSETPSTSPFVHALFVNDLHTHVQYCQYVLHLALRVLHFSAFHFLMYYCNGRCTHCYVYQYPSLFPLVFLQPPYICPFLIQRLFCMYSDDSGMEVTVDPKQSSRKEPLPDDGDAQSEGKPSDNENSDYVDGQESGANSI